jgi:hypothetical protein
MNFKKYDLKKIHKYNDNNRPASLDSTLSFKNLSIYSRFDFLKDLKLLEE